MKKIRLPARRKPLNLFAPPTHVHPKALPVLWNGIATLTLPQQPAARIRASLIWEDGPRMTWDGMQHQIGVGRADAKMGKLTASNIIISSSAGYAVCTQVSSPYKPCKCVEFHLMNAKNLSGGQFTVGDYLISMVQTLVPPNRATIFTHIGRIERKDGTDFQADQADYLCVMESMTWTLTFIAGGLVTPAILRGFNANDAVVWANYSAVRLIQRPPIEHNWINMQTPNVAQLLQEVLSGFNALLGDSAWKDAIRKAVDFYANAHSPEAAGAASLILLQAGLEKLVNTWDESLTGQALPPAANKGLGARLERMLQWASIPTTVPPQLPELAHFASLGTVLGDSGMNGPRIVAFVRNKFTHTPSPNLPPLTPKHESQAKQLAARYVELLLLRLANVNQPVFNRLRAAVPADDTEPLPWVSTVTP